MAYIARHLFVVKTGGASSNIYEQLCTELEALEVTTDMKPITSRDELARIVLRIV